MVSKVRKFWLCVFSGVVATTLMPTIPHAAVIFKNLQSKNFTFQPMDYGIFEKGLKLTTNQQRENTLFSLLIGCN